MAVSKILLYYAFAPIPDPEALRLWQRDLCEGLGLRGRILISRYGFNGTVGGELEAMKIYRRKTREYPAFRDIDFKWSEGTGLDADGMSVDFPRLSVKVRDEVVSFGAPDDVEVGANGVIGGGTHLKPHELHQLVDERGDEVVFFDGRNAWEARIGRFKGAIIPDVRTSHDFIAEIESGKYDDIKDKPVVTYCTGGIRCELLSAMMKKRGFTEVYQMDGGIVRYGEAYGNDGLWEGSLAVFDGREVMDFAPGAAVLSTCDSCGKPTNRLANCTDLACRKRLLCCEACGTVSCPEHNLAVV
ncbi:rhodanese-related sulfurtransferase [Schaalia canis]|uniref:tRNA uridine(34) hydroxylase n=1 Tax=Schaalia canis TaxID=100469 RepID=A0A3P1SH42_9ACTO|nr:rhodanese-related sulfurtransferase [Schaalia canis]RRC96239.1 rhodanese-related sulfurtransferase [Schaalia canis]